MRRSIIYLLSCFVLAACGGSPTEPDNARQASGDATLRFGQRVRVDDLAITFSEVVGESRCPASVQCVWEGDAEIRLTLEKGSRRSDVTIHTHGGTGFPKTARFEGHDITLVELTPYPGEQKPSPSSYTARLQITSQ